jgi:predicted DNA-binding transcriptional regulator AlpA
MIETGVMLLTATKAAGLLGVKPQTLARWRMDGRGPRFIRLGSTPKSRTAYTPAEIERWLDSHTATSTSDETVRSAGGKQ